MSMKPWLPPAVAMRAAIEDLCNLVVPDYGPATPGETGARAIVWAIYDKRIRGLAIAPDLSSKPTAPLFDNSTKDSTMSDNEIKLKTWPEYFEEVKAGTKSFEVRKDDRPFRPGVVLVLQEYEPTTSTYSGRVCRRRVKQVWRKDFPGLQQGYCVMALENETPSSDLPADALHRIDELVKENAELKARNEEAGRQLMESGAALGFVASEAHKIDGAGTAGVSWQDAVKRVQSMGIQLRIIKQSLEAAREMGRQAQREADLYRKDRDAANQRVEELEKAFNESIKRGADVVGSVGDELNSRLSVAIKDRDALRGLLDRTREALGLTVGTGVHGRADGEPAIDIHAAELVKENVALKADLALERQVKAALAREKSSADVVLSEENSDLLAALRASEARIQQLQEAKKADMKTLTATVDRLAAEKEAVEEELAKTQCDRRDAVRQRDEARSRIKTYETGLRQSLVWLVEHRVNYPNHMDVTVAFISSSEEKAVAFVNHQMPKDWDDKGYFTVYAMRLDDTGAVNVVDNSLKTYSLTGKPLTSQPTTEDSEAFLPTGVELSTITDDKATVRVPLYAKGSAAYPAVVRDWFRQCIEESTKKVDTLQQTLNEANASRDLHASLNRRTHAALGGTAEGEGSSWHDMPERAAALREALREAVVLLQEAKDLSSPAHILLPSPTDVYAFHPCVVAFLSKLKSSTIKIEGV